MKLIQTITLTSAASSIEFNSIPQTFTDLFIFVSGRRDDTGTAGLLRFNGDTGENYTWRILSGNGSANTSSTGGPSNGISNWLNPSNYTASTFSSSSYYVANYTSSVSKTISADEVNENNETLSYQLLKAGLYSTTSPITSLSFLATDFVSGTTVSLYGILKGSDGITTAS